MSNANHLGFLAPLYGRGPRAAETRTLACDRCPWTGPDPLTGVCPSCGCGHDIGNVVRGGGAPSPADAEVGA